MNNLNYTENLLHKIEKLKETITKAYFAESQEEADKHLLKVMKDEKFQFDKDKKPKP